MTKKINYESLLNTCKEETLDYYAQKNDIDYFMECNGVDYYFALLELLKENAYEQKYQNILLLNAYQEELMKECFIYLGKLEKYIKSYLYANDMIFSLNLLHEKRLKNLFAYLDLETRNYLFDEAFEIKSLLAFKKKIFDYNLLFCKERNHLIINFKAALPNHLKNEFNEVLETLKIKYKALMRIVNFAS